MYKALLIATLLTSSAAMAADTQEFDTNGITKLSVENYNGDVTITAVDGAKASVTVTKNSMPDKCKVESERSRSTLEVEVDRKGKADCIVNLEIKVPKMVKLDLELGTGKITTKGTQGELDFKMGAGSIMADGNFTEVKGKTGAGNIDVKGITGNSKVKTGSGNVSLMYSSLPEKGEAKLKNASGHSTLLLPKGSQINAKMMAATGHMENEFGSNKDAKFSVEAKSGSGDLKVKSY